MALDGRDSGGRDKRDGLGKGLLDLEVGLSEKREDAMKGQLFLRRRPGFQGRGRNSPVQITRFDVA